MWLRRATCRLKITRRDRRNSTCWHKAKSRAAHSDPVRGRARLINLSEAETVFYQGPHGVKNGAMSESWFARRPSLGSGLYSCEVRSARATLDFSTFRKLQKAILSAAAELGLSLRPVLESLVEWGAHHAKELDEAHRLLPCDAVVRNRTA